MRRPPRLTVPIPVPALVPALVGLLLAACLAPSATAVPVGGPVPVATVSGTPWEIAVIPGGGAFVTQRDGGIVHLDAQDRPAAEPALARDAIPSARKLLGLALAPDFASTRLAYLYVVQGLDPDGSGPAGGQSGIWRLRADGGRLSVLGKVFGGIASDDSHDGGRMTFGPDGHLYVTTGDIHQPSRPQDPASLNGKILRLAVPPTGPLTAPDDNPFAGGPGDARWVWSLGHRHPQGLAFDAAGRLWETEHGPSGERYGAAYPGGDSRTGRDELNLIVRGGNYGWPLVSGTDTRAGLIAPAAVAGNSAWAPGDLAVGIDGSLYAPFLAGAELRRFDVRAATVTAQATHLGGVGRLRVAVARGSDLLVAQDRGTDAVIYRVPLGPPAPDDGGPVPPSPVLPPAPVSVAPVPVAPVPVAPVPPALQTPPALGSATTSLAGALARTRALARTLRDAVREVGLSGLVAGRPVRLRATAPTDGTSVVSLRLPGTDGRVLDRTRVRGEAGERTRIRLRLGSRERSALGRGGRVVLRVTHRPPGGPAYTVEHRLSRRA